MNKVIKLTPAEMQSGISRQRWAELLIEQLPVTHDGRNSWLLNYGTGTVATDMRIRRKLDFNPEYQAVKS